jgi:hypothetical protein
MEGNTVYSINSTATVIWKGLEMSSKGLRLREIADYLESACKPMNVVSREEMERDIGEMLQGLHERGMILKKAHKSGAIYQIRDGILRLEDTPSIGRPDDDQQLSLRTATSPANPILREIKLILTPALADRSLGITALEQVAEINKHQSRIHTCVALLAFAAYDIALKTLGLSRLSRIIKRWPTKKTDTVSSTSLKRACAGIERARIWYPKEIMCMQHSAVVCLLLRSHGLFAQMAIGGRQMPFKSHAWVEVAGSVVNDNQKVQHAYKIFTRY